MRQLLLPGAEAFRELEFNVILSILLVCAVVASLGAGVLLAYGVCLGMFRLLRVHATQVAARKVQPVVAGLSVARN